MGFSIRLKVITNKINKTKKFIIKIFRGFFVSITFFRRTDQLILLNCQFLFKFDTWLPQADRCCFGSLSLMELEIWMCKFRSKSNWLLWNSCAIVTKKVKNSIFNIICFACSTINYYIRYNYSNEVGKVTIVLLYVL